MGAGGLGSEETFATFLHSFSTPHTNPPISLEKNTVERGEEPGEVEVGGGRGGGRER